MFWQQVEWRCALPQYLEQVPQGRSQEQALSLEQSVLDRRERPQSGEEYVAPSAVSQLERDPSRVRHWLQRFHACINPVLGCSSKPKQHVPSVTSGHQSTTSSKQRKE